MAYPIWPTSPVPANIQREINWGDSVQRYDNGMEQGSSPYVKPLARYTIQLQNIPRAKQRILHAFYVNSCRGRTVPFLFSDPYDNRVDGAICVQSGSAVRSFFVRTAEGYPVIPTSGSLRITSALSGVLTQGSHYQFDADTGVFSTSLAPAAADTWTASCAYFRKCKFETYNETSTIWDQFSGAVVFHEIALP
jgi:hypothetical protein